MVKTVVIVCDYGYIEGGAARIAHETAIGLKESGLDVIFFCAVGPVSEELQNSGIETICLNQDDILHEKNKIKGALRGINNKEAKRGFAELLDRLKPEETIIHVHTWTKGISSSIFPVAKKKKFKVVITVHDYFLICPNGGLFNYPKRRICEVKPMSVKCLNCNCDARSYPQKLFRVIRQWKQNRNIRRCDNISYIFISEFSKREFLKRYNKISPNRQYFLVNMIHFDESRFRVECEKNDIYLFIGGLTEVKGIRIFCEAVTNAGVKAIVIGQGILKEELEQKYPNIEFVGWKSKVEMLPYLKRTRCLIFPSIWYEASPLTPLEVMAYGIPVVCSDLNAASEYIEFENAGMVYNGSNIEKLCEAIDKAHDDVLLKEMSENIFNGFNVTKFSKSKYVGNILKIFERILQDER